MIKHTLLGLRVETEISAERRGHGGMHRMGIYVVTGQERVCGRDISRRQFHADTPLHRGGECSRYGVGAGYAGFCR